MNNLYFSNYQTVSISDVVYDENIHLDIQNFLKEYKHREILEKYNLAVANKILLHGESGCGKTMTAKAIATALGKKIIIVNLGSIVSSKLGETARNIASVFKKVKNQDAVIFFDEFDSLGKTRDYDDTDSGEMKRVVNTILQLMDNFPAESVFIGATNQLNMIDNAIVRRMDISLEFKKPAQEKLDFYYDRLLAKYPLEYQKITRKYKLSFAEAETLVLKTVKNNIIALEEAKV